MKSQSSVLLLVSQGLLKDVQGAYPAIKGLDFDFERLSLNCRTRGLATFTLDLPNLDSLLLRGLESGRLELEGPLSCAVSKRTRVPRLFSGLWLRVFDRDACLKQEVDATAVAFLRQLCCLGKKLLVECSDDRIKAKIEAYHDIEGRLRLPSFDWAADRLPDDTGAANHHLGDAIPALFAESGFFSLLNPPKRDEEVEEETKKRISCRRFLNKVQQVADLILGSFDKCDPLAQSERLDSLGLGIGFKHGPGAVADRRKNWEKSQFQFWPAKLEYLFPFELVGKTAGSPDRRPPNHEVASRLICVPKTAKSPRIIAAEMTAHMYCQQSLKWFMEDQLRSLFGTSFIDFRDQHKSGDLVLQASRDRDLATVDLSDASDRLSCWTVERVFRRSPSLLHYLHAARTRWIRDDISSDSRFLKFRKFASQGTATTFPVQSIVFLCIALGCSIKGRVNWQAIDRLRDQVRVYGDDIIIPAHGYAPLITVMEALQLKVNMAKSYVNGHFRESCGTDGYNGYDVTPIKPEVIVADNPASCQAVVDTTNNLFLKGYWHASDSLRVTIPPHIQRGLRIVAQLDAGYPGLSSFSGSDESHLGKRWNSRLHRDEVRVWSLSAPSHKRERGEFSALLDFFASKHSHEHARTVSTYGEFRKTRDGLSWEPTNPDARVHAKPWESVISDVRSDSKEFPRHRNGRKPKFSRVRK